MRTSCTSKNGKKEVPNGIDAWFQFLRGLSLIKLPNSDYSPIFIFLSFNYSFSLPNPDIVSATDTDKCKYEAVSNTRCVGANPLQRGL